MPLGSTIILPMRIVEVRLGKGQVSIYAESYSNIYIYVALLIDQVI